MFVPVLALALALAAVVVLPSADAGASPPSQSTAPEVTLVSFGSVQGELTHCGCRGSKRGGLPRRATLVRTLREEGRPYLHLDLGDFMKSDPATGPMETRFLWKVYEELGVDVLTPGPRELSQWALFRELTANGSIPVVSSNLVVREGGRTEPAGEPYTVLEAGGVRVGVIALIGEEEVASAQAPEGVSFELTPPVEAAAQVIPALRKEADVVVLLSQMGTEATDRLVAAVPGIDAALYGQRAPWEEETGRIGNTVVSRAGSQGQYVGRLTVRLGPDRYIAGWESRNAVMDEPISEEPELARRVAAVLEAATALRLEERARRQAEFERRLAGEGGGSGP